MSYEPLELMRTWHILPSGTMNAGMVGSEHIEVLELK